MFPLMKKYRIINRLIHLFLIAFVAVLSLSVISRAGEIQSQPVSLTKLSNGLNLLVMEDHSAPLVAVDVLYHVGSKDDSPGLTGLARICEKLMFEGTPRFPKGEYTRIIQSGGGSNSSEAWTDLVYFSSKGITTLLDSILLLEADRMANIDITYEKLFLAREAAKKERLSMVENALYGPINEEAFNLAFRAHPYQHPFYGWPNDLESITLEDLKEFFRKYFQPANATIVIVGDISTDKTVKLVKDYFEKIPALPLPARRPIVEPEQRGERIEILESSSQIPVVLIAYHIDKIGSPDNPVLDLTRRLLYAGESSRLYRSLVLDKKFAAQLGGNLIEMEDAGLIFFYAMLNYDASTDEAEKAMIAEINRLGQEEVSAAELEKVKNQRESEYYLNNCTLDQKAAMIGYYYVLTGDWNSLSKEIAVSRTVTTADIKKIAAKYFRAGNRNVIIQKPLQPYTDDTTDGGGQ
jgi:zinc protease